MLRYYTRSQNIVNETQSNLNEKSYHIIIVLLLYITPAPKNALTVCAYIVVVKTNLECKYDTIFEHILAYTF